MGETRHHRALTEILRDSYEGLPSNSGVASVETNVEYSEHFRHSDTGRVSSINGEIDVLVIDAANNLGAATVIGGEVKSAKKRTWTRSYWKKDVRDQAARFYFVFGTADTMFLLYWRRISRRSGAREVDAVSEVSDVYKRFYPQEIYMWITGNARREKYYRIRFGDLVDKLMDPEFEGIREPGKEELAA